jgi:hypothetical protein
MYPEAENGNYPAAPEPHPPEGAKTSSDPAALSAAEEAIGSEINEGAREAADRILSTIAAAMDGNVGESATALLCGRQPPGQWQCD